MREEKNRGMPVDSTPTGELHFRLTCRSHDAFICVHVDYFIPGTCLIRFWRARECTVNRLWVTRFVLSDVPEGERLRSSGSAGFARASQAQPIDERTMLYSAAANDTSKRVCFMVWS